MKILHISDTHTCHGYLTIPEDIDMIIHSGDCSNQKDPYNNEHEVRNFLMWYENLPIKYKIFCAGNHDTSIEKRLVHPNDIKAKGIIYVENDSTEVEGLKIWGSPCTPTFGMNWAWNKARHKLFDLWELIPDDTDIVITHGPPKTILDLSVDRMEFCGCNALKNRMFKVQPKFHMFGHIHNNGDASNAGYTKLANYKTIFSNGACMTDGKFDYGPSSNGNIFEI